MTDYLETYFSFSRMFDVLTTHFANVINELTSLPPPHSRLSLSHPAFSSMSDVDDKEMENGRERGRPDQYRGPKKGNMFSLNVTHAFALMRSGGHLTPASIALFLTFIFRWTSFISRMYFFLSVSLSQTNRHDLNVAT
jgi:hypothetical protein